MRDVQGFGKKRSAVGMPRPKKAKVEVPKVFGSGTIDVSTGTTGVEEASASTVAEQDDGTRDSGNCCTAVSAHVSGVRESLCIILGVLSAS